MRAEDLIVETPSVEEILKAVAALPEPAPEKLAALKKDLADTSDLRLLSVTSPLLDVAREIVDTRDAGAPPPSHRKVIGPVIVFAKTTFRRVARPLVHEILRKQVEFNGAIVAAGDRILEKLEESRREQKEWQEKMEARLAALEGPSSPVAPAAPSKKSAKKRS